MRIIFPPDKKKVANWGPLGYVSDEERERIMALPSGQYKFELQRLEKELAAFKKTRGIR